MTHLHGWAELDEQNHAHYGRGKPDYIREAEIEAELAHDRYQRAVDDYYDNHYGDERCRRAVESLGRISEEFDEWVLRLKKRHYPASEPVITPDQAGEQAW